jgi:hypothetical protein
MEPSAAGLISGHLYLETCRSEGVGPIAYLKLHGVHEVRLRRVPHAPAILYAYTDPGRDTDQSAQMTAAGVVEPGISQVGRAANSTHIAAITCGH